MSVRYIIDLKNGKALASTKKYPNSNFILINTTNMTWNKISLSIPSSDHVLGIRVFP